MSVQLFWCKKSINGVRVYESSSFYLCKLQFKVYTLHRRSSPVYFVVAFTFNNNDEKNVKCTKVKFFVVSSASSYERDKTKNCNNK